MKNGVVIVGAGHAGVQAAASLREEGYDGPVILIGDESELPYHKPPLSKTFIKDPNAKPQPLRGEAFYSGSAIDYRPGVRIEAIDAGARRLDLSGGGSLAFDHLVLATGARPRLLKLQGSELSGVVSLRSLADARLIREFSAQSEDVVILGGGFIGLEIAATLRAAGRNVTVVEAVDRLLGRAVAPVIASHVRQRLEAIGVRILTGTTVAGLEGEGGRVSAAITSGGERLPAQMVIIGIGVVPNVELAESAGIAIANGIRVDQQMRSSVPDILAIGDAASYRHWFTGADVRLESVQNATDQARLAARTILNHADAYSAVPWFWSDIGDMKLQMVGLTSGGDSHVVLGDLAENKFSIYHYAGSRLLGIESVNRPGDHMLGRKMLGAGFSPTPQAVAGGPDALKAALAAFQEEPARAAG
ncbi:NAD(P)/FAD-dependent oxidoreductase [Mesorhizobium sp. M4B.F.Ca.ET.215.01.1.1]|uniref:NAD(P)/FAD-dependent oxidoreductase n=3 Tax=Mesorhizobium TaxID=68287 RepID=UPI000FCA7D6C|nr:MULTISPECIES: FAD-dependent oxidoreductase [unclassified Mesorhizobium]RUW27418.1 NAD(P)/FAD-dependent oxidoreductase [Mesorhizobium sp. M4B.F.Ca.ET.013.02.1.1]RVD46422.1 NAD(P)/FAD-dependent oxidoreductase [Mesorhizobium sp. M4B.F.Ca.ET.019.03.1.1]TGQ15214.1 NAD(P)/FAD-dependent oxidoreductase [Mesorhizobium sp. M4B.F.Ca.ET.215.01.1.1]TGQ48578.1 NAD(P)/FAD-dependent oxidoreductase [Mesorhizobium sp. M00.F.Ca.ET.220.01.1.1]TGR11709.1 NAD(P)/FAD-dependent oxidoreductase [Mesorhizobium sp. M4